MDEHIREDELEQYCRLTALGGRQDEDCADFLGEIGAHAAVCPDCFEKLQTARLLMLGILSEPALRSAYAPVKAKREQPLLRITLLKDRLTNQAQALLEELQEGFLAAFTPNSYALGLARGETEQPEAAAENDLLRSTVRVESAERSFTARCEPAEDGDGVLLYLYYSDELYLKLRCDGQELPPERSEYDPLLKEHITVYHIRGGQITLER